MRHPTEGTLRRLVDEPAGVTDADRTHVAGCPLCLAGLAAAREDAAAVRTALDLPGTGASNTSASNTSASNTSASNTVDIAAAWHRLSGATAPARPQVAGPARSTDWRTRLRSPLVAALGVVVVLGGAGAAAAADWLQIFHTEQITAVPVTTADVVTLPDLSGYGDFEFTAQPDLREVTDPAAAADATGLDVPEVAELPRGVTGEPTYQVGGQVSAVFTFSAEKAAQAAAAAGETLPPPPAGLDGASFRLEAGPGLAAVWSTDRGLPALVVARAVAPSAFSTGVPFDTARDYLLSLPGLPEGLATQLRGFSVDGTTLPLPVPADLVTTDSADVDGASATVLTSRDGLFAGVVWVQGGVVTGVGGTLSTDELLTVARGLR